MDALAIACATREHVNLLNNEHAKSDKQRLDLRSKLCYKKYNDNSKQDYKWIFKKPWGTNEYQSLIKSSVEFPVDAKNELEKIVVSFKQNLRVINKATNNYQKFENGKKIVVEQKGVNWAIRKSLHTPMPYGRKVYEYDVLKIAENVGRRALIIDDEIRAKVESSFKRHSEIFKETTS
jgi:CRISPR-associated endonuclease Csn1